jgi:hypothetical protein
VRSGLSPRLAVTLTATLTASGRPLSGQPVTFSTGRTHLCTPHTATRGVATCVLTATQARLAAQDNGLIRASYPETPASSHHQRPRPCRQRGFRFSRNACMNSRASGSWLVAAITSTA